MIIDIGNGLDKLSSNPGEGSWERHESISPPTINELVGQTGLLSLGTATHFEEGKLNLNQAITPLKN